MSQRGQFRNTFPPSRYPRDAKPTPRKYPVIGYRAWTCTSVTDVRAGTKRITLAGARLNRAWNLDEPQPAECLVDWPEVQHPRIHRGRPSPNPWCSCGYYIHATYEGLAEKESIEHGQYLVGSVVGWGSLCIHGDEEHIEGFRVEYARVLGLLAPLAYVTSGGGTSGDLIQRVAAEYHIPLFASIRALKMFTEEYGESVK